MTLVWLCHWIYEPLTTPHTTHTNRVFRGVEQQLCTCVCVDLYLKMQMKAFRYLKILHTRKKGRASCINNNKTVGLGENVAVSRDKCRLMLLVKQ